MMNKMQELYCNDCGRYLRFKTKPWKNGKLIIVCDYCRHQHCRYVRNGIITSDRWDVKNGWGQKAPIGKGVMLNSNEEAKSYKLSLWEEDRNKNE